MGEWIPVRDPLEGIQTFASRFVTGSLVSIEQLLKGVEAHPNSGFIPKSADLLETL